MRSRRRRLGILGALVLASSCSSLSADLAATTIYVGRHFEVRERDEPVKYVFNGNTRVARTTGTLAVPQRVQRLRVCRGWNLLSLAIASPNAQYQITNALASMVASQSV